MTKPATHCNLAALPQALKPLADEKRWVNWSWEQRTNKDGVTKWTKPPLQPSNPKAHAKSNNAATWGTMNRRFSACAMVTPTGSVTCCLAPTSALSISIIAARTI